MLADEVGMSRTENTQIRYCKAGVGELKQFYKKMCIHTQLAHITSW